MILSDLLHPARTARVARLDAGSPTAGLPDVCVQYRRAVRWAGIVCPAEALWIPATATWVRRHGVAVAARSSADLSLAISAGIAPSRMIVHCDGANAGPIRCGVNVGVGQFVVDSGWQVAVLAHYARRPQHVLVDVASAQSESAFGALLATDRLEAVGLHRRVDTIDRCAEAISGMLELMAEIRWKTGTLLTRVSLATAVGVDPRPLGVAIEDALDEGCARFRFPRPGVAVSLRWPVVRV